MLTGENRLPWKQCLALSTGNKIHLSSPLQLVLTYIYSVQHPVLYLCFCTAGFLQVLVGGFFLHVCFLN